MGKAPKTLGGKVALFLFAFMFTALAVNGLATFVCGLLALGLWVGFLASVGRVARYVFVGLLVLYAARWTVGRIGESRRTKAAARQEVERTAAVKRAKEERLTKLREEKPKNYQRATVLLEDGKAAEALELFKAVADVDPGFEDLKAKMAAAQGEVDWVRAKEEEERRKALEEAAAEKIRREKPYLVNPTGAAYHVDGCKWIEPGAVRVTLAEAAAGRRPCRRRDARASRRRPGRAGAATPRRDPRRARPWLRAPAVSGSRGRRAPRPPGGQGPRRPALVRRAGDAVNSHVAPMAPRFAPMPEQHRGTGNVMGRLALQRFAPIAPMDPGARGHDRVHALTHGRSRAWRPEVSGRSGASGQRGSAARLPEEREVVLAAALDRVIDRGEPTSETRLRAALEAAGRSGPRGPEVAAAAIARLRAVLAGQAPGAPVLALEREGDGRTFDLDGSERADLERGSGRETAGATSARLTP